jgi:hypothetical protein
MSCGGTSTVSTAAAFIDMATFSELESFMYGGPHAISFFVAGVQKANWFSVVPIQLRNNGTFDFGQESVSSTLNRSGDYVLNCWFRCEIPSIGYTTPGGNASPPTGNSVRWTRNLMHNLIKRVSLTFNELTVEEFDNYWLDFNYMYRVPYNKLFGYRAMIGDIPSLIEPLNATQPHTNQAGVLLGGFFTCVLPFFFGEDSGIALPVGALPFNDTKINYEFRGIDDLLVFNGTNVGGFNNIAALTAYKVEFNASTGATDYTALSTMSFRHGYTYAHYAVIHNDERVKMGDAPRDILMRQVQTVCGHDVISGSIEYANDLRLSHGIIQYYFAFRNKSVKGEWSNYTTNINYGLATPSYGSVALVPQGYALWWDPIRSSSLIYENTTRLDFHADFYNLIHPYLVNSAVPTPDANVAGLGTHTWSYALKPWDPLSPAGSTNYSKLANVQIRHRLSNQAQYYLANSLLGEAAAVPLKLHGVFCAQNWNIVRVANGSIGHPTL